MPFYAQLDEEDICKGVNELWEERFDDKFIKLETPDHSVCGKKYNRDTKEFEEFEYPTKEPEPTTEDDMLSMIVNQEYRLTLLELGVM